MRKNTLMNICLAVALLFVSTQSFAFDRAKMDSLFDALSANNKMMGTATLSKDGKVIYQRAIGFVGPDGKKAATPDTKYRIGSISKMFTAVMIFQLVEEKKLSLTTPLSVFFPKIPNADKITIEDMLHHSSGIRSFTDDIAYRGYMEKPKTEEEMLAIMYALPAAFEPGTKNEYSNSNFVLLGYIIEKLTGNTYAEALKARITNKIGLKNTYYGGKIRNDKNEASSFAWNSETNKWEVQPETDMSIPHGAGAIVSTSGDLAKFLEALFAGKLIAKESLEQMRTLKNGFGAGMFPIPFNDKTGYGHNGGIDGFASMASYFPGDSLAFAYVTNGMDYSLNDVGIGALSIYYGAPYEIPSFKVVSVPKEILDSYVGVYTSEELPMEITIKRDGGKLTAQATGQRELTLDASSETAFTFRPAGLEITFSRDGASPKFTLKQGGMSFNYKKKQ
ncbi:MAG: serine hydrolase [Chloroflexota bacterium]